MINKILTNLICYNAELPGIKEAELKLSNVYFSEPSASQSLAIGSEKTNGEYCQQYASNQGYFFCIRIDEKKPPASAIRRLTAARVSEIEKQHPGHVVRSKELREIRESVQVDLVTKMPASSKSILCSYNSAKKMLLISNASKKEADLITSLLLDAFGSIKATTVYISVKEGLNARLNSFLQEGNSSAFGDKLTVGSSCTIKNSGGEKISILTNNHLADMEDLKSGLHAGLFYVENLQLNLQTNDDADGIEFTLTRNFAIRGIKHARYEVDSDSDPVFVLRQLVEVRSIVAISIIEALSSIFEIKEA